LTVRLCLPLIIGVLLTSSAIAEEGVRDGSTLPSHGFFTQDVSPLKNAPSFESYSNHKALVILFQPDCPWCILQFREADKLKAEAASTQILGVSLRGSRKNLLKEVRQARTKIPTYKSSPALLKKLNTPDSTPRVYVISEKGNVISSARGLRSVKQLKAMID